MNGWSSRCAGLSGADFIEKTSVFADGVDEDPNWLCSALGSACLAADDAARGRRQDPAISLNGVSHAWRRAQTNPNVPRPRRAPPSIVRISPVMKDA